MTSVSETSWRISELHPALAGHFPGNPIVPGVLVLHRVCGALMQAYGVAVRSLAVVKFHSPLRPGEAFGIELTPAGEDRYRFRVVRGDTLVAAGTVQARHE